MKIIDQDPSGLVHCKFKTWVLTVTNHRLCALGPFEDRAIEKDWVVRLTEPEFKTLNNHVRTFPDYDKEPV